MLLLLSGARAVRRKRPPVLPPDFTQDEDDFLTCLLALIPARMNAGQPEPVDAPTPNYDQDATR